jgi:signal transduction histidine kinase/ligand-binding sensor domain-containing protein
MKVLPRLLLSLLAMSGYHEACAAERTPDLADYHHAQWTAANGAPPGISTMAQTRDGWLWLGTADGLYRFDGERFERYPLPRRLGLNRDRINVIHAVPNGDLYVTYFAEGWSVLHPDGSSEELPAPPGARNGIGAVAVDTDGSLWIVADKIEHFHDGHWTIVEEGPQWRSADDMSLLADQKGGLWAANSLGVWRLDRATGHFARVTDGGGELLLAPDGALWLVRDVGSLRKLAEPATGRAAFYPHAESAYAGLFDGDGVLWLLNCHTGACRVRPDVQAKQGADDATAIARLGDLAGLSGHEAQNILEDSEGDIWISTENGLDRFRCNRLLQSGLPGSGVRYSLANDGAGGMWAADRASGVLWQLSAAEQPKPVDGEPVTLVAKGREGALLVGDKRSIRRIKSGQVEKIALPPGPDGTPTDHHMLGILDDGKELWTATMETGLIAWRDGKWLAGTAFNLPPKIYQSGPAGIGQLWLATGDGILTFYDDGKLTNYDIRSLGLATSVFLGGEPIISGSDGSGIIKDGKLVLLRAADPNVLRNVSGLVVTHDGDRWLNGTLGLVHVRAQDWQRTIDNPTQPLRYELLGVLDGYPGRAVLETRWPSAMSPDGRNLWLLGTGGVARLDTAALRHNDVAPQPVILRVATDLATYPTQQSLQLPSGTERFRIDFTAPALRMPEGVRFEYRLDGVDSGWLDAGTRRNTSYTNLSAGDYVFHLRAFNEDGVAGEHDASLRLTITPTLTQSLWFRIACVLVLGLLATWIYCRRVRYLAARLAERIEVRNAERDRIARTLHDSFLQTIYALILRLQGIANNLPAEEDARKQLETILDQANDAIDEGRDQLQELRARDNIVVEQALADLVLRVHADFPDVAIDLQVDGEPRMLHALVAEEIVAIAGEALCNACKHAGAAEVHAKLAYSGRKLILTVSDNGNGIDEKVLRHSGREGHWGLAGMHERAARIGGRLEIGNGHEGGAVVSLVVPAGLAYAVG